MSNTPRVSRDDKFEQPAPVKQTRNKRAPGRNLQSMVGTPTKDRGQPQPRFRGR